MHLRQSLLVPGFILLFIAGWIYTFGAHRPYINWKPDDLAQYLVEHNRPVNECWDLVVVDLFGPPGATVQSSCLYEYAMLKQDPNVCAITSGEFRLRCLSEVGGILAKDRQCGMSMRGYVGCNGEELGLEFISIDNPQIDNCNKYTRKDLIEWCHQQRSSDLKNIYECDLISNELTKDFCETDYSFKQKDPALCSQVKDEKRRAYCEIRINTWLQYPELRDSFYFGTPVPVDM